MAIPAAPSGLGTFHAAIVSAFVILGRPAAEGLVLAVAFHGVFFIGFCIIGAVALAVATYRTRPCAHTARKHLKKYFYRLLARYIGLYARRGDVLINLDPITDEIDAHLVDCHGLQLAEFNAERSLITYS